MISTSKQTRLPFPRPRHNPPTCSSVVLTTALRSVMLITSASAAGIDLQLDPGYLLHTSHLLRASRYLIPLLTLYPIRTYSSTSFLCKATSSKRSFIAGGALLFRRAGQTRRMAFIDYAVHDPSSRFSILSTLQFYNFTYPSKFCSPWSVVPGTRI